MSGGYLLAGGAETDSVGEKLSLVLFFRKPRHDQRHQLIPAACQVRDAQKRVHSGASKPGQSGCGDDKDMPAGFSEAAALTS
jgi:hypothetical protein